MEQWPSLKSQTRQQTKCLVENAIGLWATALGGLPNECSGHALETREVIIGRKPVYCYKPGTLYEEPDDPEDVKDHWNEKLKDDVLVIWLAKAGIVNHWSTRYDKVSQYGGKHLLAISFEIRQQNLVHNVTHEGIFGMSHERQRPDRDEYVRFICENFRDYSKTMKHARTENPSLGNQTVSKRLCEDADFSKKYGFPAGAIVKGPYVDAEDPFDYKSIMLYPSKDGTIGDQCHDDGEGCTLLKVTKWENEDGSGGGINYEAYGDNLVPSEWDVKFVRKCYPHYWVETPPKPPKPTSFKEKSWPIP
ncbi:hypothetical protein K458DRAFT_395256 [Lentithecium fluviatile CBS 122367]|uniref:Uncharacterized protein n=1 Tax=Lentithecium fluviatile CBS 122367 TaxID=1168545 RepID=A0A6G1IJS0_9PLEO|nr:hypothetical protein K458DRAFT_395256 [Lentithecium fluviatile CBS 122367]